MANFLSKLFGTKSDRDLKDVKPMLDATLKVYPEIQKLSNDELRAKTIEFKEIINKEVAAEENELASLRERIENEYDMPVNEKEEIYKRIDKLEKDSYEKTQKVLNQILPEAFSVGKETARRFAENEEVVVTATDHDRELAVKRDNVNIEGDKAIYKNSWMAGGNMIKWDMVHYDVQLIVTLNGWACSMNSTDSRLTASTNMSLTATSAKPPIVPTSPSVPTTNSALTTCATT